jgi:hypothetical protein
MGIPFYIAFIFLPGWVCLGDVVLTPCARSVVPDRAGLLGDVLWPADAGVYDVADHRVDGRGRCHEQDRCGVLLCACACAVSCACGGCIHTMYAQVSTDRSCGSAVR